MFRTSSRKALVLPVVGLAVALGWRLSTANAASAQLCPDAGLFAPPAAVAGSSALVSHSDPADPDGLHPAQPDNCYPFPCSPCGGCPIIIFPYRCPPLLFGPEPTVPAPPPGGQSTPLPTATNVPVPTPTPGGAASSLTYSVCRQMDKEIPASVQQKALAEPWRVYGYGRLQNPNIPFHPLWNPYRTHLTVRDFVKRYGRCNDIMWKASCP